MHGTACGRSILTTCHVSHRDGTLHNRLGGKIFLLMSHLMTPESDASIPVL